MPVRPEPLPVVGRCTKCGREFVTSSGGGVDPYPPLGWEPARLARQGLRAGWAGWLGECDPRYPPPVCGGAIVPVEGLP